MKAALLFRFKHKQIICGIAVLAIVSIVFSIAGFEYMDEQELASLDTNQPNQTPTGKVSMVINTQSKVLDVYNDEQVYKKYRIAVGKSKTPTPIGEWNVVWKDYDWGTGFGTRWMGLNVPWARPCGRLQKDDLLPLINLTAVIGHAKVDLSEFTSKISEGSSSIF